jgi:hypothetical protein
MVVKFLRFLWLVPLVLPVTLTAPANAETKSEVKPPLREELIISASEGDWILKPVAGAQLKIESKDFDSWLTMEQKDGHIEIRSRDQLNKVDFGHASGKPHAVTVLVPANMEINFHLIQGSVSLQKLSLGGFIAVQKAKLFFKDVSGAWDIRAQRGDLSIVDSQGQLKIDSYGSKVEIKNFNGELDLANFIGESLIEKSKGFVSLNHGAGTSKIQNSSGNFQFEARKGSLFVTQFDGRVEGQSGETGIAVTMLPDTDINVRSQAGRVQITTPANSGASLNLASQEGEVAVPNYLKVNHDTIGKSLRAKLHGEGSKGSVFVRTQEGAIVIR